MSNHVTHYHQPQQPQMQQPQYNQQPQPGFAGPPPEAFYYSAEGTALGYLDPYGRPMPFGGMGQAAPAPAPAPTTAPGTVLPASATGGFFIPLIMLGLGIWAISELVGRQPTRHAKTA